MTRHRLTKALWFALAIAGLGFFCASLARCDDAWHADATGREVYLPAGEYTDAVIDHRLNLRGDGRDRTVLRRVKIQIHGAEDFKPKVEGRASGALELEKMSLINCDIDLRFASWLTFRDVHFFNCRITGFSAWSVHFDNCHLVKTKVVVQDALKGKRQDNRGFSGKWRFRDCEFEAFDDWAVYLGFRSRLCSFDNVVFDTKAPGEHTAILLHPGTKLEWSEHRWRDVALSADEPRGTMVLTGEREEPK